MAYDPPPQNPGGPPPEESPAGPPAPTPPSENPPSPPGAMQPPPGGYVSPPGTGGYTPPSSGYTPPQGGYTPPQGGGYGTPPPPVPPTYAGPGMGALAGGGQVGLQGLLQSYLNAVTRPNVATYQAEFANASWLKVGIGIGIVTAVSVLTSLLTLAGSGSASLDQSLQTLRDRGVSESTIEFIRQFIAFFTRGGGLLLALLFTAVFFFLGAGVLYILARVLGGRGTSFMTHAYLLSLSYVPIKVVSSLLGLLSTPTAGSGLACITGPLTLGLYLYMLYSAGLSMQVSQGLAPGRAQLAAFLPLILGFLFLCLCIVGVVVLVIGAASGTVNK
jgi:hypothetical protein